MRPEHKVPGAGAVWPLRLVIGACLVMASACGGDGGSSAAVEADSSASAASTLAPGPSPALAAAIDAAERSSMDGLPEGGGKELLRNSCMTCHSATMIAQQHKDTAAWDKTVTGMVGYGAPLAPERKDELIAYLVANFGPRSDAAAPAPSAR